MKIFNLLSENINISGGIYCIDEVTFQLGEFVLDSHFVDETVTHDMDIKGDLFIVGKLNMYQYPRMNPMEIIWKNEVEINYNKMDFRVIKADLVNMWCHNIKIGRDITAYYDCIDELRILKLNHIRTCFPCT